MPKMNLQNMRRMQDIIHTLASDLAARSWALLSPQTVEGPVLSPEEYFRFCRAFYRVELFFYAVRGDESPG